MRPLSPCSSGLNLFGLALLLASLICWAGCRHKPLADSINPADRFVFPGEVIKAEGETNGPTPIGAAPAPSNPADHGMFMRVGEKITVTFSDLPPPGLALHEQRIREDGTITLPFNKTVKAAGKTAKQLEEDIRNEYVPSLYVRLTVTVKTEERFFYVGGEVKIAARQPYVGHMTILRAVQAAGDFTDFANRKKIELIRTNGERLRINWYKAIQKPELDLEVYPGDTIVVHRRWF